MIQIPVSVGELIDKITILEIKIERIADKIKRENCLREYQILQSVAKKNGLSFPRERSELKKVNERLWDIEDKMRRYERDQMFDESFISITRDEYRSNDLRAKIKKEINLTVNSEILEEKEYVEYVHQK